jgi:DNA repair protein RecO (recombination protein O)
VDVAYVLHHHDWSESSLILDLFTRDHGRVAVAAKGAKRPYSQLRSVLVPFQRLNVAWSVKRAENAEIHTLRSAEWAGGGLLPGAALLAGFYLNELLIRLLPRGDAHPLLFDAYAATLPVLAQPDGLPAQAALRAFELVLLREHGVLPALDVLTQTQQPVGEGSHALRPEIGLTPDAAGVPGPWWRSVQAALDAGDLPRLHSLCALALVELKAQLRRVLHYHLGHPPLRTRQLMMELQP